MDLLFKTLETQVYDIPPTATATTTLPHTASTDMAPVIAAEPAPTKISVTKQVAEPLLSESLNTANAPSNQPSTGHQVSISV